MWKVVKLFSPPFLDTVCTCYKTMQTPTIFKMRTASQFFAKHCGTNEKDSTTCQVCFELLQNIFYMIFFFERLPALKLSFWHQTPVDWLNIWVGCLFEEVWHKVFCILSKRWCQCRERERETLKVNRGFFFFF